MEFEINRINGRYRMLRQEYERIRGEDPNENEIHAAPEIAPFLFGVAENGVHALTLHRWSWDEELRLLELYGVYGPMWEAIRDEMNEEFGASLTTVQVKNKLYVTRGRPRVERQ